jgi:hypothetical protein
MEVRFERVFPGPLSFSLINRSPSVSTTCLYEGIKLLLQSLDPKQNTIILGDLNEDALSPSLKIISTATPEIRICRLVH